MTKTELMSMLALERFATPYDQLVAVNQGWSEHDQAVHRADLMRALNASARGEPVDGPSTACG